MVEPRILSGFMELLPEDQIKFNNMVDKIRKSLEKNKNKWPQIAHHSSRIRAHRVHHRPFGGLNYETKNYKK